MLVGRRCPQPRRRCRRRVGNDESLKKEVYVCDDWVMQTNGLLFEKQKHHHVLKNETQRGTTDC